MYDSFGKRNIDDKCSESQNNPVSLTDFHVVGHSSLSPVVLSLTRSHMQHAEAAQWKLWLVKA